MTTRFPNLPVLGHVPKKRKEDVTKVVTLESAYKIIHDEWMEGNIEDWPHQELRRKFKEAAVKR